MPGVAGEWAEPSLKGARRVYFDGVSHTVPEDARLKLVKSSRIEFLHVNTGREVFVLCRYGELIEDTLARRKRAAPDAWSEVAGDRL